MMKIEVRCCCQPQKLLGWLPVPDDVRAGQIVKFIVSPAHNVLLSPALISNERLYYSFEPADIIALSVSRFHELTVDSGHLPIDEEHEVTRDTRLALKSEDTPLERLRMIPSFLEAEL